MRWEPTQLAGFIQNFRVNGDFTNIVRLKEYIPVQSMEKTVEILLGIVRLYAKSDK